MKKLIAIAIASFTLASTYATPVGAVVPPPTTTYSFSYSDGNPLDEAHGLFTASGADITSITGTVGSNPIIGLLGYSGPHHLSPSGYFDYDNQVVPNPTLDSYGILFSVSNDVSGQEWNLWGNGGHSGSLYTYVPGNGYSVASDGGTLNVSAVPEPETLALIIAGLGTLMFVAKRREAN